MLVFIMQMLRLFTRQVASKDFIFFLVVSCTPIIFEWAITGETEYSRFVTASLIAMALAIGLTTAVHESVHLSAAVERGVHVSNLVVRGLGNVSFSLEGSPEDKVYAITAPYVKPNQYLVEALFTAILAYISYMSPGPLNYVLIVFPAAMTAHMLSLLCTLLIFKGLSAGGTCTKIALSLGSRDDILEYLRYVGGSGSYA